MADSKPRWLPLESNPQAYNAWCASLGLDTSKYSFQEVYGLDPELLAWVKQPVKAVVMLFPVTPSYEKMRDEEDKKIVEKGGEEGVDGVLYFKQTRNACGAYALIHSLANIPDIPLSEGPLKSLFTSCLNKTPRERSALLALSEEIATAHTSTASSSAYNQTETPDISIKVEHHFIAFVEHGGCLIELDGSRESAVNRGKIKDGEGLLEAAVEQVKKVAKLTGSIQFSVATLSPTPDDE
ncbi:ubiquitin carboxyl-terminal hydrolase L3 [Pseudohyphozyma bogoriensis]|nr:ubiquitin carboxyl-terminal hydrolase L3 [Pseudohyphozyma bogoriensis]